MKNKERDENMIEMYQRGATLEIIGINYNLTKERVRQILNELDVDTHKYNSLKKIKIANALRNNSHLSAGGLAQLTGVHSTTVSAFVKARGVKLKHGNTKWQIAEPELRELYIAQNKTIRELTQIYNVCAMTVSRKIREFGLFKQPTKGNRKVQ